MGMQAQAKKSLVSLAVLWRFKLHEPIVVGAAGLAGVALWPLVRGGGA